MKSRNVFTLEGTVLIVHPLPNGKSYYKVDSRKKNLFVTYTYKKNNHSPLFADTGASCLTSKPIPLSKLAELAGDSFVAVEDTEELTAVW